MNTHLLNKKFSEIGARLKFANRPVRRWQNSSQLSLDIGSDRRGEFFEFRPNGETAPQIDVLDVQSAERHLLLMVREKNEKNKYLCGHDERHWFVAGIPEAAPVGTVGQAMLALQPREVQQAVSQNRLSGRARNRRKNAAFLRQGEWFFLPVDDAEINLALIRTNEPLRRGNGGKPHWAEVCFRTGGELVYVCDRHPNGVTERKYHLILSGNTKARSWNWRAMRRNPGVYVRGRIRHSDHATITLQVWHRVVMNTENQSRAMLNVAFLD